MSTICIMKPICITIALTCDIQFKFEFYRNAIPKNSGKVTQKSRFYSFRDRHFDFLEKSNWIDVLPGGNKSFELCSFQSFAPLLAADLNCSIWMGISNSENLNATETRLDFSRKPRIAMKFFSSIQIWSVRNLHYIVCKSTISHAKNSDLLHFKLSHIRIPMYSTTIFSRASCCQSMKRNLHHTKVYTSPF